MAKSREHWTQMGRPPSNLELLDIASLQHFQRLIEQDAPPHPPASNSLHDYRYEGWFSEEHGDCLVVRKIGEGG